MKKMIKGKNKYGKYKKYGGIAFYKYNIDMLRGSLSYLSRVIDFEENNNETFIPAYFEFGVYNGNAAHTFSQYIHKRHADKPWQLHLFDSWEGLPETNDIKDIHPDWEKGTYTSKGEQYVIDRIASSGFDKSNIHTTSVGLKNH